MKTIQFAIACLVMLAQGKELLASEHRARNLRSARGVGRESKGVGKTRDGGSSNDHFGQGSHTGEFVEWAAGLGKTYSTTKQFIDRLNIWNKNDQTINDNNAQCDDNDADCMRMGHNKFSDMTDEEREAHLGLKGGAEGVQGRKLMSRDGGQSSNGFGGGNSSGGVGSFGAVDWFESGHTGAVKDQGWCGSCYVFSANTTLEAAIAIETGNPYQRLSEQQIVDCGNWDVTQYYWNYGCNGGYMSEVWWFQMDRGAMTDADYPYVSGTTGTQMDCVEDPDKYVASVDYWNSVPNDLNLIGEELNRHPLAIAVSAGVDAFYFYESGIIKAEDCYGSHDHAVVLVGYTPGQDDDDDGGDGGDDEDDMIINEVVETECRKQRWKDKFYDTQCRYTDEYLVDGRFCCWDNVFITETHKKLQNTMPTWRVQNSWGAEWGENGFVRFEAAEGNGTCNMNNWVEWVTPRL